MNNFPLLMAQVVGAAVIGLVISYFFLKGKKLIDFGKREERASALQEEGKIEAEKITAHSKEYVQKKKEGIEQEKGAHEERFKKFEDSLNKKEVFLQKKNDRNSELKSKSETIENELKGLIVDLKEGDFRVVEQLEKKTGEKSENLKEEIIINYQKQLELDSDERIGKMEERLKEESEEKAKSIVMSTIQRLTTPTSVESRAVHVKVPKDQIKGKIVGKAGKNIAVFEELMGVYVVFNDLPNTISLSAFNLVKRRIAKRAMEKLVEHRGEINKRVIERAAKEAERETDDELYEIGRKALKRMNVKHDNKEFCRVVGRLQYRTSYGQNIMMHSMEVGWVSQMLGSAIGLNTKTCRVGGFLHDLGKAIDQDPEITDPHDLLSKKLMEKYEFSWEEIHAAWTHHDAIAQETPEAMIVKAADAVSASRPGARQESFVKYIERIIKLEETAKGFEGVRKAFALSAGREIRVMVDPERVSDGAMRDMANRMAEKIEDSLTYPGQIKVNIVRRTKHTETTR
jgi:ribonucrease Y